jgi:hypothetical protein
MKIIMSNIPFAVKLLKRKIQLKAVHWPLPFQITAVPTSATTAQVRSSPLKGLPEF